MSENEKNAPKRRFKEFENADAWEQRKLGELADIVRGASPRPIQDPKWFDDKSTVGWLRISDVSEQDGRIYYLEQHISKAGQEKTRVLMQSHLLLSIAASVGKPVINYVSTGVHDGFLIFQNPTFDREFMFQWMKMFEDQWQKYGQPGSQVNLNSDIVKNQVILIPKANEQVKIGTFFSDLDNLITLHQHKLEKMKALKKAYLMEMFPAEGESKPKLRFAGFKDDWEQCELGDISDVTKLAGFEFTEYVIYSDRGTIIALRGLNVKNGKIILDDVKYIDQSDFSKLNRSKLVKNDILFTYVGTVGELAIIQEDNKYYLAPNVARIRLKKEINSQFVIQMMGNKTYYDKVIFPLIATSSQPALSMENVRKFILKLPSFEEQTKIGEFFEQLDNLITLHQRKLEKLQNTKKAYLNEMFI